MVTVRIFGGLGNQLFEYAFGRSLSLKKNDPVLVLDYYDQLIRADFEGENLTKITDAFDLPVKLYIGKMRKKLIHKRNFAYLDRLITGVHLKTKCVIKEDKYDRLQKEIEKRRNIYLIGYWQSEQYFNDIKDIIRNEFKFKIEQQARNLNLYKEIIGSNSVSLHIRGKDYLIKPMYKPSYGRCDVKYYMDAIDIISRFNSNLRIFIFTDDIDNVYQNYKELLKFSKIVNVKADFSSDTLDLLLMSKCKHNVIANSSFSWWGAWLNKNPNKIVIAPKKWFIDPNYSDADIIPSTWNKI